MLTDETKASFFDGLKSKEVYERWIAEYENWAKENVVEDGEDAFSALEFLKSLEGRYAATSLWTVYSILNKYFKVYKNISLKDCVLIKDWLKHREEKHLKKKAEVFSRPEIDAFLGSGSEWKNKNDFIMKKCALVVGLHGLLRVSELTNLEFGDVREDSEDWVVRIRTSKTDRRSEGWSYRITGNDARHIREYVQALPKEAKSGRFFKRALMSKKRFSIQPVGKNTLGSLPRTIARFLKRDDEEQFSGHTFRRTGATILADAGANRLTLKRAGRWKSDTIAESYLAESRAVKTVISTRIGGGKVNEDAKDASQNEGCTTVQHIYINHSQNFNLKL